MPRQITFGLRCQRDDRRPGRRQPASVPCPGSRKTSARTYDAARRPALVTGMAVMPSGQTAPVTLSESLRQARGRLLASPKSKVLSAGPIAEVRPAISRGHG
jgi:hypothetical protein